MTTMITITLIITIVIIVILILVVSILVINIIIIIIIMIIIVAEVKRARNFAPIMKNMYGSLELVSLCKGRSLSPVAHCLTSRFLALKKYIASTALEIIFPVMLSQVSPCNGLPRRPS